jgi:hypothetical protein
MPPEAQFTPTGVLILSPMIGPWDRHEVGSQQWAEAVAMHLQHNYRKLLQDGTTSALVQVLREALNSSPHPWDVYPPQAKGDPERWMRLVTGAGWKEIQAEMERRDPEAWKAIAMRQAEWEAKHRPDGRPSNETGCGTPSSDERDNQSARGIRRRLQKRANAGDEQAMELVSQLAAGDTTVNQAAITAGMRKRYIRVPATTAEDAAVSLIRRMGAGWAHQLAEALIAVAQRNDPT